MYIINIKKLIGIQETSKILRNEIPKKAGLRGSDMDNLNCLEDAYLHIENGKIMGYGLMKDLISDSKFHISNSKMVYDASGQFILPAWCDSHTHIVYAGSRESEFEDKIKGLTYEEIAQKGGGILNSAKKLNETSENELFEQAWQRLEQVKKLGTGAIEIKSGYGLNRDGELKMLRVIRRLKEKSNVLIKSTFLAAHAYPLEYKNNHQGYIDLIINDMLPKVADENLADYIDVFCEKGFFSVEETEQILEAGLKYGLKPKIHANQLHLSGGVQVGVKYGAISVDHLECIGDAEIDCLKNSNTMATLLPSAAFFLRMNYQPARKMIDAGLPIALATDYNPGSSPSGNIPFLLSLSCIQMRMTPQEAINALTINGAYAMEAQDKVGSITIGKKANLIFTKNIPSIAYMPYSFGENWVDKVMIMVFFNR